MEQLFEDVVPQAGCDFNIIFPSVYPALDSGPHTIWKLALAGVKEDKPSRSGSRKAVSKSQERVERFPRILQLSVKEK